MKGERESRLYYIQFLECGDRKWFEDWVVVIIINFSHCGKYINFCSIPHKKVAIGNIFFQALGSFHWSWIFSCTFCYSTNVLFVKCVPTYDVLNLAIYFLWFHLRMDHQGKKAAAAVSKLFGVLWIYHSVSRRAVDQRWRWWFGACSSLGQSNLVEWQRQLTLEIFGLICIFFAVILCS